MPVSIGDPLNAVTANTKGKRGGLVNGVGYTYSVAIGLALWAAA